MNDCIHTSVTCLNPYELIRKYRCDSCQGVMMCACEEKFARRFLNHQIDSGRELDTQRQVAVTLGFQSNICNPCRDIPEKAHPTSPKVGRTSKIARYYWREIAFDTIQQFAEWAEEQGYPNRMTALIEHKDRYRTIEREVIEEIKRLHQQSPKYIYHDESQSDVIVKHQVEVVRLDGTYIKKEGRGVAILYGRISCGPEDFAARHFRQLGYTSIFTESIPFHVLFGVFLWMLVQDPKDIDVRQVGFGRRDILETGSPKEQLWTYLPSDFGTRGYAGRRASAIEYHFASLPDQKEEMLWLFDYWLEPSEGIRQYLWAHRPEHIAIARAIVSVLPLEVTIQILRYLVRDYWQRYCGWPDILFYNQNEFFFAEVKSSNDELSEDQKNWIKGNGAELHLPFKLIKIHKKATIDTFR
jgi:VRR-NUC domain